MTLDELAKEVTRLEGELMMIEMSSFSGHYGAADVDNARLRLKAMRDRWEDMKRAHETEDQVKFA